MQFDKVVWAEGILLSQQHLQYAELALLRRIDLWRRLCKEDNWGIICYAFDEEQLNYGQFFLIECEAVFQSGKIFSYSASNKKSLSIALNNQARVAYNIYLTLPLMREVTAGITGLTNYDAINEALWQAYYKEVADIYDANKTMEIAFASLNVSLSYEVADGVVDRVDSSNNDRYEKLLLARLEPKGESGYIINKKVSPPLLVIKANQTLCELLQNIHDFIALKQTEIQSKKIDLDSKREFDFNKYKAFFLNSILNKLLFKIKYLLNNEYTTPREVYIELISAIAEIKPIACTILDFNVQYDHNNIYNILAKIKQELYELIEASMPRSYINLNLIKEGDNIFHAGSIPEEVVKKHTFIIMVKDTFSDPNWTKRFVREVTFAAKDDISAIIAAALPGLQISYLERIPSKISIKSGYEYFMIAKNEYLWKKVIETKNLSVHLSQYFINMVFDIIVFIEES